MPHCIRKSWLSYAMHICIHRLKISTMTKSQMHLVETWKHHNLFEFNIQWKTTAASSICRQTASHTQLCHQLHPPDCHQTASLASLSPNHCTHWFVMGPPHLLDHHMTSSLTFFIRQLQNSWITSSRDRVKHTCRATFAVVFAAVLNPMKGNKFVCVCAYSSVAVDFKNK